MNKELIFNVAQIRQDRIGAKETFTFSSKPTFEGLKLKAPIEGLVEFVKIEEGIAATLKNVTTKAEQSCEKCLTKFTTPVTIQETERIFYADTPDDADDPNDTFLIDKKKQELDLSDMLRQEIILHFPLITVCSTKCKGLCSICGKNRNEDNCDCKPDAENKPLSILKDLIK